MGLRFVFGPAGCGKSTFVQEELINRAIKNSKETYLCIVPDQFTMQTQSDIVKRHPQKGILNIDVLSFGRLSYRVFSETGKTDIPILDDTGKSLVVRRVASKVSESMPYLGKNLNKIGYVHEIKSQICEFMQYGLSVKDVRNLAEKAENPLLKHKLSDISVIYEAFMEFNKDKYITGEETLDLLCKKIYEADFLKGSTIVFDGFTGFTPIQERVILRLLEVAKEVVITFTLSNPETPEETGFEEKLFYLSRKGANRLKTKAKDLGIEIEKDIIMDSDKGRFSENPELRFLEENIFRFPYKTYKDEVKNIGIISASDIEAEVSKVCLIIDELIRKENYAYKDIAIITGNEEEYAPIFEKRMRELNMPNFIDKTNAIVLNPFTEYLKSALQILIKDYSYDSVFHYLRSGFTEFSEDEIDRFDRYISSLNIRGKSAYSKEFKRRERGLNDKEAAEKERLIHDEMRSRLYNKLSLLDKGSKTAGDYAKNLYEFLKENNSFEKLKAYRDFFEEENDLSKAKEYEQIYKCIMELLDTIVSLIGEEEMDINEFYKIFEAGIREIEVGTIPKNVDRILIGDIERTRVSEVKALFLVGCNDTNIPKATDKGGILSSVERESLLNLGFDLAPTPREEMYTQKLYLYMNMCKPKEKLFITYAGCDTAGKSMRPAYLIETIKKIFPEIKVSKAYTEASMEAMSTLKDSERYYAMLMREYVEGKLSKDKENLAAALYKTYEEEGVEAGSEILKASFKEYLPTPLSKEIVRLLYTDTIRASISRMELYAGCAYSHFLKYAMGLKKNMEYSFEASDLGTIYHGVLDNFSSELERRNLSWRDFTKEEGKEMVKAAVKNYCEEYDQGHLLDDEESAYTITKITRIMERTVDTLQFHVKQGKFLPGSHEYSFEREIALDDGKKMLLNGKVDRFDIYETDDKVYVKIVDYKSGERKVDVTNIYHGIEQQLSVYMKEVINHEKLLNPDKEVLPSALLYYTIDNPMISVKEKISKEEIDRAIKKELKVEGLIENSTENISNLDENAAGDSLVLPIKLKANGELDARSVARTLSKNEFFNMLDYVGRMIKEIGNRIYEGDKRISPAKDGDKKDACKFCDYKSICRFDEKIKGYKARDLKEIDDEKAREIVMGEDQDGLYLFD